MKKQWQLPDETTDAVDTHQVEHIIDYYDGPMAVSLRDNEGRRFFALAADSEGPVRRWIEVEIEDSERHSLLRGQTALRDVFRKPVVYVVDRRQDFSVVNAWAVNFDSLQDTHLPAPDAFFEDLPG